VNLPRRDKMMKPRYQELLSASIPTVERDGVSVRVIAGQSLGASASIETRTPIMYLHVKLAAGTQLEQSVPRDFNLFAFVISGHVLGAAENDAILFARDGDSVVLRSGDDAPAELLLIGGRPINEPIARYGPFVMKAKRRSPRRSGIIRMDEWARSIRSRVLLPRHAGEKVPKADEGIRRKWRGPSPGATRHPLPAVAGRGHSIFQLLRISRIARIRSSGASLASSSWRIASLLARIVV